MKPRLTKNLLKETIDLAKINEIRETTANRIIRVVKLRNKASNINTIESNHSQLLLIIQSLLADVKTLEIDATKINEDILLLLSNIRKHKENHKKLIGSQ